MQKPVIKLTQSEAQSNTAAIKAGERGQSIEGKRRGKAEVMTLAVIVYIPTVYSILMFKTPIMLVFHCICFCFLHVNCSPLTAVYLYPFSLSLSFALIASQLPRKIDVMNM